MCQALAPRYPGLAAIGAEAKAQVALIDSRLMALRQLEDDQINAKAIEDAEKIDVVDSYTELRRTLAVKEPDVIKILPDAPSALRERGPVTFIQRLESGIANLKALADADPVKALFLPQLEQELLEFGQADKAEDAARSLLRTGKTALLLFKAELSAIREAELGLIQSILRDKEKTALFTIPWRKYAKGEQGDKEAQDPQGSPSPTG